MFLTQTNWSIFWSLLAGPTNRCPAGTRPSPPSGLREPPGTRRGLSKETEDLLVEKKTKMMDTHGKHMGKTMMSWTICQLNESNGIISHSWIREQTCCWFLTLFLTRSWHFCSLLGTWALIRQRFFFFFLRRTWIIWPFSWWSVRKSSPTTLPPVFWPQSFKGSLFICHWMGFWRLCYKDFSWSFVFP